MSFGLNFAAACGLAAFAAFTAPASAATFDYNLTGDTNAGYTDPAWPGETFIDLTPAPSPGYKLRDGDTIHATISLNNPVAINAFEVFLQETNEEPRMWYDLTFSFLNGGVSVPTPSVGWLQSTNAHGGLGFDGNFTDPAGILTFDQVVVTAVITSMTLPGGSLAESINLTDYVPYFGFYGTTVATTPLPGALLLMMTALGGLGIVGRRKRAAATSA
jgi:hypothetical protein